MMKIYEASGVFLPRPWLDVVGAERHHQQGYLIVIAATKKHAAELLNVALAAGARRDRLVSSLRVNTSTPTRLLIDTEVIDLAEAGMYAYLRPFKDQPVARVTADGTASVIAHFRYDPVYGDRGLWVESVETNPDAKET